MSGEITRIKTSIDLLSPVSLCISASQPSLENSTHLMGITHRKIGVIIIIIGQVLLTMHVPCMIGVHEYSFPSLSH